MIGIKVKFEEKEYFAALSEGVVSFQLTRVDTDKKNDLFMNLGGMKTTSNERVNWLSSEVRLGDKFYIEICEVENSTPPSSVKKIVPEDTILEGKLKAYSILKEELEELGLI